MNTVASARSAHLKTMRASLFAGAVLAIVMVVPPACAQVGGDAQAGELTRQLQQLKQENEKLRRELAAARHQQGDAAAPAIASDGAVAGRSVAVADAGANASDARRDESEAEILVRGRVVGAALRDLKDVPKPISIVTQAELRIFDEVSLPDALSRLGNVRWNDGNPRTGSFSIRGLTAGAGTDTIDPSIGLTIDGVPYAYLAMAAGVDLVDIDQVNVTRGPQGTIGARNTSVGQINVTTRAPSFTTDAAASLTFGANNALRAEVEGGGSLIDGLLAFRITATRDQRDGTYWNQFPDLRGLQSHGNIDRTYGRVQLLLTPSDRFRIRLLYDASPNGDEYVNGLVFNKPTPNTYANGAAVDKTNDVIAKLSRRWFTQQSAYTANDYYKYNVYLDSNRAITTGGKGGLVDASWDIGKQTLSLLSSARKHYFLAANDDGTPFDISRDGGYISTYWQVSNELKLTGAFGDGFADYTAGLFYLRSHTDSLNRTRQGNDSGAYNANVAEYTALDANSSGRELMTNSLARVYRGDHAYLDNESKAAFAQIDWHLSRPLTLTTGFRLSRESRKLSEGIAILDNGYGAALNPVNVGAVQLGGFGSAAFTAANAGALTAGQSAAQLALADAVALQYFGVAPTATAGGAYNSLSAAQRKQVAAAKAIRLRTFSTLFNQTQATPWIGNIYTGQVSLRNDFTEHLTGYGTVQYGEKPGIAQFNGLLPGGSGAPRDLPAKKERTISYELGVRSNWFDGDLVLNANVFRSYISDFQQSVYLVDELTTALNNDGKTYYISGVGNVGKVRTQGVEADFVYSGLKYATFRFSGAYTDAKYLDFQNSGQPSENANLTATPFRDVSGQTLPNAPKVQFNVTGDYRRPVFRDKLIHASLGYTYTGSENGDTALSSYGYRSPYGLVDLSLGLGRRDGLVDVNLVVRNLLNEARGDPGWSSYTVYQRPRWIGAAISSKFK